jgi:hypothetical protein
MFMKYKIKKIFYVIYAETNLIKEKLYFGMPRTRLELVTRGSSIHCSTN